MPAAVERVVEHADDSGRALVARALEPELLDQLLVARAAGDRRRPRVRHVRQQRAERDDELDPDLLGEAGDEVAEAAPAEVRLDPDQDHRVAIERPESARA